MKTKQLKEIQTHLDRLSSGLNAVKAMVRNATQQPDSSSLEQYDHLLPEGYEFCEEDEAEDWLKVESKGMIRELNVGETTFCRPASHWHDTYRPIRKTPPPTYEVDWTNAPVWADVHCFDKDGKGYWYGVGAINACWDSICRNSFLPLPNGLDWKLSKTFRPQ